MSHIPPNHIQIYQKVNALQNPQTKLHMIETLLNDPSIVHSAKLAGVYAHFLSVLANLRNPPASGRGSHVQQTRNMPIQTQTQTFGVGTYGGSTQLVQHAKQEEDLYAKITKSKRAEKALSYFTTCLRVLGIQEEVALTEEFLNKAYKKAVIKAHPDKGGSKEAFDAVTRAYAYLGDILKMTKGRKTREEKPSESYEDARQRREQDTETYKHVEPIRLNPNNLNMNLFNQMFEQTRIPDPDEDGYGDWLKGGDTKPVKKFSEDFNRDVFNRMFEEEVGNSTSLTVFSPQELVLAPSAVELGRDRPPDYTAAANASLKYTDLRSAYTKENTLQDKVRNAQVYERNFDAFRSERERAPDAYNPQELDKLRAFEQQKERAEEQRRLRAAHEQVAATDYFERMKQLVITDRSEKDHLRLKH